MKKAKAWRIAWVTVLCFGIGCPAALGAGAPTIPIGTLVAQRQDLAGFGPAVQMKPVETTFALEWALTSKQGLPTAEREANVLERRGFEAGVDIEIVGRHEGARERREADSVGIVFSTAAGATEELAEQSAWAHKEFKRAPKGSELLHGQIPGIPGSAQFGAREREGGIDNVLFSVGRCYFVLGDSLKRHTTARQIEYPLRSAAVAAFNRARGVCIE